MNGWSGGSLAGGIYVATEKRARKKQYRDAALAQRAAEERRRRLARLGTVGVIALVVVILAIFSGNDGGGGDRPSDAANDANKCQGDAPPEADPKQYESPPELTLEEGVNYSAVISTTCGEINVDLNEDTEKNVAHFIFLAREGFYDGLIWHRVELNSVIQSGDPNGLNGVEPDGPGYTVPDEPAERANQYVYGVVGMANTGQPNSGGSQFFVVIHDREGGEPAGYPPDYAILGEVDPASYDVLDLIGSQPTRGEGNPAEAVMPIDPIYVNSIEIIES